MQRVGWRGRSACSFARVVLDRVWACIGHPHSRQLLAVRCECGPVVLRLFSSAPNRKHQEALRRLRHLKSNGNPPLVSQRTSPVFANARHVHWRVDSTSKPICMKHRNGAVSFSDTLIGHPLPAAVKAKSQDAATPQLPPLPPVGCSQPAALPTWRRLLRRVLPQVVSVFIGACFIVIRPISSLSGDAQYGFLILVIYTLFFFAGENTFGRHLQITLIGILGAAVGVGWSALAVEIGCIANRRAGRVGSVGARIAPALFLATIAFAGGYGKSKFPRLSTGFMLSIFVSIWLISSGVAIDRVSRL